MNKRPSFQFYPADWIKDPQLQKCSAITKGVWINLLCRMWESPKEGQIKGTDEELTKLGICTKEEIDCFKCELFKHKFAKYRSRNGVLYITNTRMNDAFLEREGIKKRVQSHRKRKRNANVTSPSSTSSSTSSSRHKDKRKFVPPTLTEVQVYIRENNYNVNAVEFIKYYASSDPPWHDQNGKPVRSWKQKLIAVWAKKPKAKKCAQCGKLGVYTQKDDAGQPYWLCEDHKPPQKPLPKNTPVPQMKKVPDGVNINDARRKNLDALGIK